MGDILLPNILITGTPGTGKTTTSQILASNLSYKLLELGVIIKENSLHDGYSTQYNSYIINDDAVIDYLEPLVVKGGCIIDHHGSNIFPERYFQLVICLTCTNTILYDRLAARGYTQAKIEENVECEIMRVVLDEARDSYSDDIVIELSSNSTEQMESNVARIEHWVSLYLKNQSLSN